MRKTRRNGGFFICLLLNMLLNSEGLIPAAILLILHFAVRLPLWCAFAALGLWLAWLILWMIFFGWAGRCAREPDPYRENKNPYSAGQHKKQAGDREDE